MEQRRRRSRTSTNDEQGQESSNGQTAPTGGASWLKRGDAIMQTAAADQERQKEKSELRKAGLAFVNRLWVEKGKEREVIILDKSISDVVALYEHNLKDSQGRWGNHESCVKEFANCPLCEKFKESYYVMFFTVLDLAGYDRKDDKGKVVEHIPQVRRLLAVKSTNIGKFKQLEQAALNECGTMRGMYLVLQRGTGDQSAQIGEPAILDNGKLYEMIPEDELVRDYGHDQVLGKDGKTVIKEKNADLKPYDYDKLFPKPDPADLAKRYGIAAGAGSAQETLENWGANEAAGTQQSRRRRGAAESSSTQEVPSARGSRSRARPATPAPAAASAPAGDEPFAGDEPEE